MNEMTKVVVDIDAQEMEATHRLEDALIWGSGNGGNPFIVKNVSNAVAMLTHHAEWEGVLAFDEFNGRPILTAPIPCSREDNGQPFPGRIVKDADYTATRMWFDRHLPGLSKEMIIDAFDQAVHNNVADPLRQYIEDAMAAWDGKTRIERLFDDYFVSEHEDAYSRELGKIAMMTLVQRALYPGAFQKMVPILEGKQDIGKSSGLRALCPKPEWFLDNLPRDLNSSDTSIALKGTFLIEMAELTAFNRVRMEEVKAFVTRCVEDYRPKYGKNNVQEPRRCMAWGTTNSQNYLRDETGSARFFPIGLIEIDVEAIARDRDQLLGEAGVLLTRAIEADKRWWEFSEEARALLGQTREEKSDDHPWTSVVLNFVEGRDEVSIREILTTSKSQEVGGLGFDDRHTKRGYSDAVAGILQRAGWVRDGQISAGKYKSAARYVREN